MNQIAKPIALIAAQSRNGVIGDGPNIPWKVKGEQKFFKEITMNGTLVMGRKTFDSIGRPLPGRNTIIVTRQENYKAHNCIVVHTIDEALQEAARLDKAIFIAGGGEIYAQTIDQADDIHLSVIDVEVEGDVKFPPFPENQFKLVEERHIKSNIDYVYRHFRRLSPADCI